MDVNKIIDSACDIDAMIAKAYFRTKDENTKESLEEIHKMIQQLVKDITNNK